MPRLPQVATSKQASSPDEGRASSGSCPAGQAQLHGPDASRCDPAQGAFTLGPWTVCQHLKGIAEDAACTCGYRGVVYGPDDDMAVCQPGHDPAPKGQEGSEPGRYPRSVEIANAHLIAAAPDLYAALEYVARSSIERPVVNRALAALARARGEAQ